MTARGTGSDSTDLVELQRPVLGRVTTAAALQALATVLAMAPAVATVEVGRRLLDHRAGSPWPVVWITVGLLMARLLLYVGAGAISHLADTDLADGVRRRMTDHLAALPLGWFAGGVSGRVKATVVDDVDTLHHAVAHARGDLASAVAGPLAVVAYLAWVDWRLVLLTVAIVAAAQAVRMRLAARASEPAGRIAAANAELAAATVEMVRGIDVIKAFGGADGLPRRFHAAATAYADADADAAAIFVRQRSLTRATVAPATVILFVTAAGIGCVSAGWTRPVDVIAFILLGVGLFEQLTPLYSARTVQARARAAAGRIGDLLREPVEPGPRSGETAQPREPLTVEFDDVSFGYTAEREVLQHVSVTLEPGTVTALVGASGAGKSTMAALLARFYDVTGGSIRVAGVDVRDLGRDELYRRVGFLFQDDTLLRASVRDNIALARPEADDDAVRAAARAACVHDRILALPRGYDSVVGEDARLSGGEAQRLAIARTLLAGAPIVVLDEATAHADPESEAAVQDALAQLVAGRTLLVIAHRLHTVTAVDQILVLDSGRVVERGTHPELLAANGHYATLWRAQGGST